jgi:hypothetical protein
MSYPPPGEDQGRDQDPTQQQSGPPYGQSPYQDPYGQHGQYGSGYGQPGPSQYGQGQPGQPGGFGQPGQYGGPAYAPGRRTNVMAILSLVLSIVGLFTCITAPVGAVLGHLAKRQIAASGEEGGPLATAGIIVGWIITGLYAVTIVAVVIIAIAASTTSTS